MPHDATENHLYPAPRRALVVEDHRPSADAFAAQLRAMFRGIDVRCASTLACARAALSDYDPDLVLLDIGLPDGEGTALLNEDAFPSECSVVMVTIFDDDSHLFEALEAGARGYLLKGASDDDTLGALRGILSGQPPLSPGIARRILESFHRPRPDRSSLSPRERDVLSLVAKGYSVPETAEMLGLRANTASSYLKEVYRKLQVRSRAEATLRAARMGLISVDVE